MPLHAEGEGQIGVGGNIGGINKKFYMKAYYFYEQGIGLISINHFENLDSVSNTFLYLEMIPSQISITGN